MANTIEIYNKNVHLVFDKILDIGTIDFPKLDVKIIQVAKRDSFVIQNKGRINPIKRRIKVLTDDITQLAKITTDKKSTIHIFDNDKYYLGYVEKIKADLKGKKYFIVTLDLLLDPFLYEPFTLTYNSPNKNSVSENIEVKGDYITYPIITLYPASFTPKIKLGVEYMQLHIDSLEDEVIIDCEHMNVKSGGDIKNSFWTEGKFLYLDPSVDRSVNTLLGVDVSKIKITGAWRHCVKT